jgi:hypothetical protein
LKAVHAVDHVGGYSDGGDGREATGDGAWRDNDGARGFAHTPVLLGFWGREVAQDGFNDGEGLAFEGAGGDGGCVDGVVVVIVVGFGFGEDDFVASGEGDVVERGEDVGFGFFAWGAVEDVGFVFVVIPVETRFRFFAFVIVGLL